MYRAYHIIGYAGVLFVFSDFGGNCVPKGDDGEEIFNVKHTERSRGYSAVYVIVKYVYISFGIQSLYNTIFSIFARSSLVRGSFYTNTLYVLEPCRLVFFRVTRRRVLLPLDF
jgi:hypothetical protein